MPDSTYRDPATGTEYRIVFDGRQSLLDATVSRPSVLALVAVSRRAWTRKTHRAQTGRTSGRPDNRHFTGHA